MANHAVGAVLETFDQCIDLTSPRESSNIVRFVQPRVESVDYIVYYNRLWTIY